MSIVFILLGALPATLLVVSKLGLGTPPAPEAVELKHLRSTNTTRSREDLSIAA